MGCLSRSSLGKRGFFFGGVQELRQAKQVHVVNNVISHRIPRAWIGKRGQVLQSNRWLDKRAPWLVPFAWSLAAPSII